MEILHCLDYEKMGLCGRLCPRLAIGGCSSHKMNTLDKKTKTASFQIDGSKDLLSAEGRLMDALDDMKVPDDFQGTVQVFIRYVE